MKNIGQTMKMLKTRIREHQMPSSCSNIYLHTISCEKYKLVAETYVENNIKNYTSPPKAKFYFFQNRFNIIGKGFLRRTGRPSINDQFDHRANY